MIALSLRLKLIKALTALAFMAGFFLSPLLWRNTGRLFPLIKPFDFIPTLPAPFDLVFLGLFVVSLVAWIFYTKKAIGLTAVLSLIIIMAQDQMRWQPWVYIYLLMLLPYLFQSEKSEAAQPVLNSLQLIISGVYIWSGFHKLQVNFIDGPFAQIVKDSGMNIEFSDIRKTGYFIPLIEISMGVMLLIPKVRKAGIFMAIGMHLFILFYLSQWATIPNSVVYPWNTAMILLVLLIFWGVQEKTYVPLAEIRARPAKAIPLALVWIFPLFNFFGFWDHYPSFSFYSNKPAQYYIAIKNTQVPKTDKSLHQYFTELNGLEGGEVLEMNHWTLTELNVPFYPELRLFKKLSTQFYDFYKGDDSILFLELTFTDGQPNFNTLTYEQLQAKDK